MPEELVDHVLTLVRRAYPDWNGFDHPKFVQDEITYKREAAAQARDLMSEDQLHSLVEEDGFDEILQRLKKVGHATNLLYLGVPSSGDLAVLHAENLDPPSFCRAVLDLLYGAGPSPKRLGRFTEFLAENDLPNKWTFPTYLLFLNSPDSEYFVKPGVTRWFLKLAEVSDIYTSRPNGETYAQILGQVRALRDALLPYGARDMIDVQSVLWVAHSVTQEAEAARPSDAKRREMESLFEEFGRTYLTTQEGREHQAAYERDRVQARQNYEEILEARNQGDDVTDSVLLKLLPYVDSASNREKGAWIHVAPSITGDLKRWFEAKGWREPGDWTEVAEAILAFVERSVADPADLERACKDFAKLPWSKGFQSGMLTPILNALRPDDFLLVNNKSRRLINYLSGKSWSQKLTDYPEINRLGHLLVEDLSDLLETALTEARPEDVLDAFSHWLTTVRKFPFGNPSYWKIAPGEGAKYWEDCLEGGFISIGWNDIGDVSKLSREEFDRRRSSLAEGHEGWTKDGVEQVWKFKDIREGDKVVANEGTGKILGFGTVTGPYEFVPDAPHSHRLPVDWDDTRPRRVQEGGWRRALVSLDRDKFNKLLDAPGVEGEDEGLSRRAFDLLEGLAKNPVRAYYSDRREEFKLHVESPFQELMQRVIALLPEPITSRMETEKGLFSRIPKNDYGRGGAWPFYWGALYPMGGKRTEDAQLILALLSKRLEAGFYIGEYGSETRKRFLKNVSRHRDHLPEILKDLLSQHGLAFGERARQDAGTGALELDQEISWRDWLNDPGEAGIKVVRLLTPDEALKVKPDALAERVAETFQDLFPLVLLCISDEPLVEIRRYLGAEPDEDEAVVNEELPLPECAAELRMDLADIQRWVRAIDRKKQAILYGPPGTGKTFAAEVLARHLVGGGDGFMELVQFHPSYAYEDFIQGIRPEALPEGGLDYPVKRGRFLDFCHRAKGRDGTCVLIIDEINRANLSRVFGELMYLLEYRGKTIPLSAGGEHFSIPDNVRILGTMNTADRSIALVDHALRRRFAFLELRPSYETLRRFHEGDGYDVEPLVQLLQEVNAAIGDPHYEVGITYFLLEDLENQVEDVWMMEVLPYLEEYFFDQRDKVERFRWKEVRGKLQP